ncbi:MAG: tetraacyldisaccharide 4'-kinase [Bacteroidaceae bacterium]|nr:tetraacyldisaccharide 4'-kinase [Bacteroidaceae bacterium]
MHIYKGLLPLAYVYGLILRFRNWLYDKSLLRVYHWQGPLICVGNLTVGGTGKTPMTEYLVRLLQEEWSTAILSRGFRRSTHGFIKATPSMTAREIGDEPWQMKHKFSKVDVYVDANRHEALTHIFSKDNLQPPQVLLLDDAFQHRKISIGMNILLTDYHRLIYKDHMLPAGSLREPFSGRKRAQIVVVTKCPASLAEDARQEIIRKLKLRPEQKVFFSTICYHELTPVFPEMSLPTIPLSELQQYSTIVLISGIARPEPLQDELKRHCPNLLSLTYPDHHPFSASDINHINQTCAKLAPDSFLVVTTEKDAARLYINKELSEDVKPRLYAISITTQFLGHQQTDFNNIITTYVRENQANIGLAHPAH